MTEMMTAAAKPINDDTQHFISLGAGVQSSVMLLMADRGLIEPTPKAAIFADTRWEPRAVYEHLQWLKHEVKNIPVEVCSAGDLRNDNLLGRNATGDSFITMPLFLQGNRMAIRQCTSQYKIFPIRDKVKELMGFGGKQLRTRWVKHQMALSWIGITTDEAHRMKPPTKSLWLGSRWPLIEMDMTRDDCKQWFDDHYSKRELPRSACIACPYRSAKEWLRIKENDEEWRDAVEFDRGIRNIQDKPAYVHRSEQPLEDVDFSRFVDDEDLWGNECEGMCGL